MSDKLNEIRQYLENRYAALTVKAYLEDIHRYLAYLNGEEPSQANAEKFLTYLSLGGNKGRSLNRHLAALKVLFDYQYSQSKNDNDKLVIKSFRVIEPPIVWLEEDEQKVFLAAAITPLEKAVAYTLLGGGLRLNELLQLEIEDIVTIEGERNYLRVLGKGSKTREVKVQSKVIETIDSFVANQRKGTGKKIFNVSRSRIEHMVKEIAVRAGIKKTITPHKLRHSFATQFLETSGETDKALLYLRDELGHTNISTTSKYLHTIPSRRIMPKVIPDEEGGDAQ